MNQPVADGQTNRRFPGGLRTDVQPASQCQRQEPRGRRKGGKKLKPKIFITQPMEQSALKKLKAHLEVEVHPDAIQTISKESLIRGVQGKDYLLCRLGDQIDADVISANTKL